MNDKPFLSAICPVYGGVVWLEQAIDCFLKQDYDSPRELVVVNSCPQQKLEGTFPNVAIVNLRERPASLGELRNIAINLTRGEAIVIWDSDDLFMPHHLSTFAEHYADNDWVWLTSQYWIMGDEIQGIVKGACPLFSFKKEAWSAVGGYPSLTVGEDAALISKITERLKGKKVTLEPEQITFGYRWGQGSHHVSGEGPDVPGKLSAHDRAADALKLRINRGEERTGKIVLKPNSPIDWPAKAKAFLDRQKKTSAEQRIAFVELGRFGDIVNILPLVKHCAETYGKPAMVVSRQFAKLLDGCSYVDPFVVDLDNSRINEALKIANREFAHVINCQIWGQNYEIPKVCASYNRESWRMAGFLHKFEDKEWVPVFDRRDLNREAALWNKLDNGKKMLLVNVTRSVSSVFPEGKELLEQIRSWFASEYNIINVADLILPQIYDLIGIMDRAQALVAIDTSLIHLAAATSVPVVALLNPRPWQGTEPRCNCVSTLTYTQVKDRPLDVRTAIIKAMNAERYERVTPLVNRPPIRAIAHVLERHVDTNAKQAARKQPAQKSWDTLYLQKGVIPCHLWKYPRNALSIGDVRALPYLKDVLALGIEQVGDDDIVMWCNDDNVLHPELPDALRLHISLFEVCTSQRCEFHYFPMPHLTDSPNAFASRGEQHMGRDLFAATKRWLVKHWDELPDFILGASDFDLCLACMVRLEFGIITTRQNIETSMHPAELRRGYVAHQWHAPKWLDPANVDTAPSQIHNRKLFREWARHRLPDLKFSSQNVI